MNDSHDNRPESIHEQIERLEIEKIRLETQLIEASMCRDRVRLALDIARGPSSPRRSSSRPSPPTTPASSDTVAGASVPGGAHRPLRRSRKPLPARSRPSRATGTGPLTGR